MWTEEHRARHDPRGRRYPSDLTDEEWALIAPFIPPPRSGGRGRAAGRAGLGSRRGDLVAVRQWRAVPRAGRRHRRARGGRGAARVTKCDPLHQRLQPLRYLHDCSDCFRPER